MLSSTGSGNGENRHRLGLLKHGRDRSCSDRLFWQYYGILQCGTREIVDAILAKNAAHAGSAGQKKKTEHRAARRHSTATIHCKDSLSEGENRQGCYSFFFIKRYLYCLRDTIPRIGLSWMKLRTFKAANSTALLITPGTIAELCGEPMKLESSQKG